MFRPLVVFCFAIVLNCASHATPLQGPIPAEVTRIVDGDTVRVRAMIWLDQTVEVSVRLRGIDAPELYRPKCDTEKQLAKRARQTVQEAAPIGSTVQLRNITKDKYGGRVVAELETSTGDIGSRLVRSGQAITTGESKPWCETD